MLSPQLLARLVDVHAHPVEHCAAAHALRAAPRVAVSAVVAVGTSPLIDWSNIQQLAAGWTATIPAFGIHPWQASCNELFVSPTQSPCSSPENDHTGLTTNEPLTSSSEGTSVGTSALVCPKILSNLRELLASHPNAWVGEIGLDRAAVSRTLKPPSPYPFDRQLALFKAQLDIARDFDRIVSVHMVRFAGGIVDIFINGGVLGNGFKLPRRFVLHSFCAKPDVIRNLLTAESNTNSKLYFSFSYVLMKRLPWFADVIRTLPQDRILVESDLPDLEETDKAISDIVNLIAESRNWSVEEAVDILHNNMQQLLNS